jgi:hypothetical protein
MAKYLSAIRSGIRLWNWEAQTGLVGEGLTTRSAQVILAVGRVHVVVAVGIPVFDGAFKRHLVAALGAHVNPGGWQEEVAWQVDGRGDSCMASFASCNSKSWSSESPTMVSNLVRISGAFMKVGR